jgi:hypothetical protein
MIYHNYLGAICRECLPIKVGGYHDDVHILVAYCVCILCLHPDLTIVG